MDIIVKVVNDLAPNCNVEFEACGEQIDYLMSALKDGSILFEDKCVMLNSILPELNEIFDEVLIDKLIDRIVELYNNPELLVTSIENDQRNLDLNPLVEPVECDHGNVQPPKPPTSESPSTISTAPTQPGQTSSVNQPIELSFSPEYVEYKNIVSRILKNTSGSGVGVDKDIGACTSASKNKDRKSTQKIYKKNKSQNSSNTNGGTSTTSTTNANSSRLSLEDRLLQAISYDTWVSILDVLSYIVITEDITDDTLKQQQGIYMECCTCDSGNEEDVNISEYSVYRLLSLLFSMDCITPSAPSSISTSVSLDYNSMNFNYSDFESILMTYAPALTQQENLGISSEIMSRITLTCMHMLLLNLCRCMLMPDMEYENEEEEGNDYDSTTQLSNLNLGLDNEKSMSEIKEPDKESIDFLTNMFPQIPISLVVFLYCHKFGRSQSGVAEYLAGMLYNNAAIEGLETCAPDSDDSIYKIIEKIKIMKSQYQQKVQSDKKADMIRRRKIQEMIRNKYSDIAVTPLYDEKTGKLIKKQYDPKTFLGITLNGYISSSSQASSSCDDIFNWGKGAIINPSMALKPKKKNNTSVRYLENQVVTHKGEKSIIVKTEYEREQAALYGGPLRGKENKGSAAKAAASKASKAKSNKK